MVVCRKIRFGGSGKCESIAEVVIDSHAHVALRQFDKDRDDVIRRARDAGVSWIEVGTDIEQSAAALILADQHDNVWPTVGVHPSDIGELKDSTWPDLEKMAADPSVVAIGEVGLDYYRGGTRDEQLPVLEQFMKLADKLDLPVIFHVRDGEQSAHDDLIEFLKDFVRKRGARPAPTGRSLGGGGKPWRSGVIHTFSGTNQQAEQYLDLGLYLSFSGVVTFKNAGDVARVARTAPLDRILIETDCPFLAPDPHRGARNEPSYVQLVAQKISDLRSEPVEKIEQQTEQNTRKLFNLAE